MTATLEELFVYINPDSVVFLARPYGSVRTV